LHLATFKRGISLLNLLKTNNEQRTMDFIVLPRTCNPRYNYPLLLYAYFVFLIIILIFGSINSSATLFADAKEQEITRENILSKISLATQWLTEQQRPDGSWPIVTQDKRSSVVATGLFGLGTFNQTSLSPSNIKKALSFLLAHQHDEGYWEATSSFSWNKVEATTAALYGLISAGYEGKAVEKGMYWLIKNQNTNGSWNDDCWDTSWALYLLLYNNYPAANPVIKSASLWLVNDQRDDGSWKTNLPNLKQFEPLWTTPPVIFTLAQTGQHQNTITKGLKYLKNKQNKNGSFGRKDASKTGLALLTFTYLSEYPGLTEEYRPLAERAVQWFLSNQRHSGTWPGGFHPFDVIDTAFSIRGLNKFLEIF
jgi:squalene cyclase